MQPPEIKTPTKRSTTSGTSSQCSPLSKANTPVKLHGAEDEASSPPTARGRKPKFLLDDPLNASIEEGDACGTATSCSWVDPSSCPLLAWAQARGSELGLVGKSGADARRERVEKRKQARGQESGRQHWFGEYDEENPDQFLLLQDLYAMHKRGCEVVSVTVLSDDAPFDASSMVGPGGSADLDSVHALDEEFQAYDEEEPDAYLLSKDLIAMSKRRPGEDVEVVVLSDAADDDDGLPPQDASAPASRIGADDGCWGSGDVEYSEDDPDAYLLCKDLENLAMRGVERVELTVIRDDEGPDVECLLWPHGSGHLCLKTHYGEAIQQLYPGEGCGWTEEEKEEGVQNYLLMKDLEALQAAGADAVSVTLVSHDEPEAEAVMGLVAGGWDESGHVYEGPREALFVS